jgi:hypothetical protein
MLRPRGPARSHAALHPIRSKRSAQASRVRTHGQRPTAPPIRIRRGRLGAHPRPVAARALPELAEWKDIILAAHATRSES